MAIAIKICYPHQAPVDRKCWPVAADDVNVVVQIPDRCLIDAGIVFDAVLHDYPTLEAVAIPELDDATAHVAVAVLKASKQPQEATTLPVIWPQATRDWRGIVSSAFSRSRATPGASSPRSRSMPARCCGRRSKRRSPISKQREGVRVTRVYNGCGILVAADEGRAGSRRLFCLRLGVHEPGAAALSRPARRLAERAGDSGAKRAIRWAFSRSRTWRSPDCASASATRNNVRWAGSRSERSTRAA